MPFMEIKGANKVFFGNKLVPQIDVLQQGQVIHKFLVLCEGCALADMGHSHSDRIRLWTSYTFRKGRRRETRAASKIDLEYKQKDNEESPLGPAPWHTTVTRDSSMVPDAEASVG